MSLLTKLLAFTAPAVYSNGIEEYDCEMQADGSIAFAMNNADGTVNQSFPGKEMIGFFFTYNDQDNHNGGKCRCYTNNGEK